MKDDQFEKLTTDEWEERYKPLDSPQGETLVWEFVDLYGEHGEQVIPENRIWTLVDADNDHIYALPGFHVVNRFGYAVTERPWEHRNIEARYDHDEVDS